MNQSRSLRRSQQQHQCRQQQRNVFAHTYSIQIWTQLFLRMRRIGCRLICDKLIIKITFSRNKFFVIVVVVVNRMREVYYVRYVGEFKEKKLNLMRSDVVVIALVAVHFFSFAFIFRLFVCLFRLFVFIIRFFVDVIRLIAQLTTNLLDDA